MANSRIRPPIKWAGGKTQLLEEILPRIPSNYSRYIEPFVGGGAVFFAHQPKGAFVSDLNERLINLYFHLANNLDEVISELNFLKDKHNNLTLLDEKRALFLEIRRLFNEQKQEFSIEQAARFIYLNKTCFNGLFRENSKGEFNVPFGQRNNANLFDESNLSEISTLLKNADVEVASFERVLDVAESGDFVYFDPPYVPLEKNSDFTSYQASGFGPDEQKILLSVCQELDRHGVMFIQSNSSAKAVYDLYGSEFKIQTVDASRNINSRGTARGTVKEVLVSNFD